MKMKMSALPKVNMLAHVLSQIRQAKSSMTNAERIYVAAQDSRDQYTCIADTEVARAFRHFLIDQETAVLKRIADLGVDVVGA